MESTKEITSKLIEEAVEELFLKNKDREISAITGKEGAINYLCILQEHAYELTNGLISDAKKETIREGIEKMNLPNGMYKISSKGIEYLGIYE